MIYLPDFTCPHCGQKADIVEEEACPTSNVIEEFCRVEWGKKWGKNEDDEWASRAEINFGPREVHEPDVSNPTWHCSECNKEIDSDILTGTELFNWLYEKGMLLKGK